MKEQKDEKWLDELIAGNINTSEPKFDAENWKKKYSREFQTLADRGSQTPSAGQSGILRLFFSTRTARIAAAAVLVVCIGLLIAHLDQGEPPPPEPSSAQMVTAISLRMAYRRGGMEALEQQCDKAVNVLGLSSKSSSLGDLLTDLNG